MNQNTQTQQYMNQEYIDFLDLIITFFRGNFSEDQSMTFKLQNWEIKQFREWNNLSSQKCDPLLIQNVFYLMIKKYAILRIHNGAIKDFLQQKFYQEENAYNEEIIKICSIFKEGLIFHHYGLNENFLSFLLSHLVLMHEHIYQFQLWDELYDIVTGKQLQVVDQQGCDSLYYAVRLIKQILGDFKLYSQVFEILQLFSHDTLRLYIQPCKMNQEFNNHLIALIPQKFLVHIFFDSFRHQYYRNIEAMILPCNGIVLHYKYIESYFNIIKAAQLVILILLQLLKLSWLQENNLSQDVSQQFSNMALNQMFSNLRLNEQNQQSQKANGLSKCFTQIQGFYKLNIIQDSLIDRETILNLSDHISQQIINPGSWENENIHTLQNQILNVKFQTQCNLEMNQ